MRRLLGVAAALALGVAVVEIVLLILVVKQIGGAATLLLVLATSLLGAFLLRTEGLRAWRRFRSSQAAGLRPGDEVSRGLAGVTGAFLLLLPGFLTDVVGLVLVSPPGRRAAGAGVRRAAEKRLSAPVASEVFGPRRVRVRTGRPSRDTPPTAPGAADGARPDQPEVIEGEIVDGR